MKTFAAKITRIDEKVWVTYTKMNKPMPAKVNNKYKLISYNYEAEMKAYKSSFIPKEVENVRNWLNKENVEIKCVVINETLFPIKVGMSCQIVETKTGCKIVKILK